MARHPILTPVPVVQALPAHRRRLDEGQPPLSLKAARSVARSQAYQSAADAPSTAPRLQSRPGQLQGVVYRAPSRPEPSTPEIIGAYLADAGRGYAMATVRRRVAAIARAHRIAKQPLDTRHPATASDAPPQFARRARWRQKCRCWFYRGMCQLSRLSLRPR